MIFFFFSQNNYMEGSGSATINSPAEIQDDLAKTSIENVFVYSDRYGHSDLKSD